jgi:hypothetical protein
MQENKEKRKHDKKFLAFMSRLTMVLFGGFTLIVPMLIMDLHPPNLTSLPTRPVFVLAVAVCLAAATGWEPGYVIGATAAFIAVLVIFVRTAIPGGSLSDGTMAGIVTGVVCGLYLVVLAVAFVIAGPTIRAATFNATRIHVWTIWLRVHSLKTKDLQRRRVSDPSIPR